MESFGHLKHLKINRSNYHVLVNLEPNKTGANAVDSEHLLTQIEDMQLGKLVVAEQSVYAKELRERLDK